MHSTPNPKSADVSEIAPDVVLVARAEHELSRLARETKFARAGMGAEVSADPSVPPVDTAFRAAAVNNVGLSIGGRAIRAFMGLLVATCIGVAGYTWQAYGDAAKQMIAEWVPQFLATSSQLVATSSPPPENQAPAEQPSPPAVQAAPAEAPPSPAARAAPDNVAPTAAEASPEQAQLQSMARDLVAARQEIEQLKAGIAELKASQEQMSRGVAKVSDQNMRAKIAAIPPRPAAAQSRKPPPAFRPAHAAAAPAVPQASPSLPPPPPAAAPYPPPQAVYVPSQATTPPPADPNAPRPPMPVGQQE